MSEEYEALHGQVEALSLVLTSLISSLPASQARTSLVQLETAFDLHCEKERQDRQGDLSRVLIREAVVEAYVELLKAASLPRP